MPPSACLLVSGLLSIFPTTATPQQPAHTVAKLPTGVYAVVRDGAMEKDVLPLKQGEALAVDRHGYLKKGENEPPRYLVLHAVPDVLLDLAGEPTAVKEGDDVVRVLFTLKPKAAEALERVTRDQVGKQVAIVIEGEVVTAHKVRTAIKGGRVQVSSCTPGGGQYILDHLRGLAKK